MSKTNSFTVTCTRRAWIREPNYPIGSPAPGRINCPCGHAPLTYYSKENGNVPCTCGILYAWDGTIIKHPPYEFCVSEVNKVWKSETEDGRTIYTASVLARGPRGQIETYLDFETRQAALNCTDYRFYRN